MSKDNQGAIFIKILKEAHDHGFGIGQSNIKWAIDKSWMEFLKQHNLISSWQIFIGKEAKKKHRDIAKSLRKNGFSIRQIASKLGYRNPGSVSHLLNS